MKNPNKIKLSSWSEISQIGVKLNTPEEQYIIPMGAHGLPQTKVVLDEYDEIMQELKFHDDNKFSKAGTIILIGSEY